MVYPLGIVGPWELVIIAMVILLLFGGKKLPELMKGLGKGIRGFKQGLTEVEDDLKAIDKDIKSDETKKD